MTRMPTLFIPHGGGPCFFMEWDPPDTWDRHRSFLETPPASLPEKPKALLVISGHWEAREFTVQSNPAPPLLFDYNGFPQHTYELTWPAPGDPALATRVGELLQGAGFETGTDTARGFDHGVFVPLKLVFPEADIPTVQLSLRSDLDPDAHLAVGRALAPLRDEGVLIIGSGLADRSSDMPRSRRTQPQACAVVAGTGWARRQSARRALDPVACRRGRGGH